MSAADAVNLQIMAGAHDARQQAVALGRVGGQVRGAEVRAA